jgi:hypothetical protein
MTQSGHHPKHVRKAETRTDPFKCASDQKRRERFRSMSLTLAEANTIVAAAIAKAQQLNVIVSVGRVRQPRPPNRV